MAKTKKSSLLSGAHADQRGRRVSDDNEDHPASSARTTSPGPGDARKSSAFGSARVEMAPATEKPYPVGWDWGAGFSSLSEGLKNMGGRGEKKYCQMEQPVPSGVPRGLGPPLPTEGSPGVPSPRPEVGEAADTAPLPLRRTQGASGLHTGVSEGDQAGDEEEQRNSATSRVDASIPEAVAVAEYGADDDKLASCYCNLPCCGWHIMLDKYIKLLLVAFGIAAISAVAIGIPAAVGAFDRDDNKRVPPAIGAHAKGEDSLGENISLTEPTDAPTGSLPVVVTLPCKECSWVQIGPDLNGVQEHDLWGFYVSLAKSGTRLAVSATHHDNTGGTDSGLVCVYDVSKEGVFSLVGQCLRGNAGSDHIRGSLSKGGSRLVTNAPKHDSGMDADVGRVQIYELQSGLWTQLGGSIIGEEGDYEYYNFGKEDLSWDGNTVAIGAPQGTDSTAGRVRVYHFVSGAWTQMGEDIKGEAPGDRCGPVSMAGDGLTIAIGSWGHSSYSGHVRVFHFESGSWTQLGGEITCGEGDSGAFGAQTAISIDGRTVAASANMWPDGNGKVCVFSFDARNETWTQVGKLLIGDAAGDTLRQVSLSDDGRRVATGSFSGDGGRGYIRIYDIDNVNGSSWVQVGDKISGQSRGEWIGTSISLSDDGARIAIGGISPEYANTKYVGGDGFGVARLYELRPHL